MKILQVLDGFVPAKFGGIITVCYNLSKALTRRGHEVFVYTTDADVGSRLTDVHGTKDVDGIKVSYFRNISNLLAYKYRLFLPLGVGLAARKEIGNYDVIHLNCLRNFLNVLIHHYAQKYNIPYVLEAHGSAPRIVRRMGLKWLLKWLFDVAFGSRLLRDASRVIAETGVELNEYIEAGVNQDKIVLLSPPFDIEEFSQLPPLGRFCSKYNIEDKRIILFLGRIHWIKGLDFLVESFCQLAQYRDDVILVIVGPDDGYKPAVERRIRTLNLTDKVLFTGFLDGEEKLSAIVDAEMLVQTSIYERGARSPFEVVLCNVPIIASKNTGAGEEVGKIDAGYLVEYGNKGELTSAMQYILDNPAEARSKTQKAKEYIIGNLSWQEQVAKYEKLYSEAIEGYKK